MWMSEKEDSLGSGVPDPGTDVMRILCLGKSQVCWSPKYHGKGTRAQEEMPLFPQLIGIHPRNMAVAVEVPVFRHLLSTWTTVEALGLTCLMLVGHVS